MKKIKIGFSTRNSIFSALIRFFSRSSISHTYIRIPLCNSNNQLIFQASGLKVNAEGSSSFASHSKIVKEITIEISDEKCMQIESFMCESLGKPYSIMQIIGMLWVLFCRNFGKRVRNPFADGDHSYVCVELVANVLDIPGSEEMTPQDLYDYILINRTKL